MRKMMVIIIIVLLIANFYCISKYYCLHDNSIEPNLEINQSYIFNRQNISFKKEKPTISFDSKESRNNLNNSIENISKQDLRAETMIKIVYPRAIGRDNYIDKYYYEDIEQSSYDSSSPKYVAPGLVFTFQVLLITNGSEPEPVVNGLVVLTINTSYSVFRNRTINYTDSEGYLSFIFNSPLRDSDWGYILARTDPEELEIIAEYLGNESYKPSETLPIETTHWPSGEYSRPPPPPDEPPYFCCLILSIIFSIIGIAILFIISQNDKKQYREYWMR